MKIFCLFVIAFFLVRVAAAGELFQTHRSVRAMGMGNAFISIVDDEESLHYNPAGIAKNSGIYWTVADIGFGINDLDALTNFSDLGSAASFETTLNSLYGNPLWGGGGGRTAVSVPFFMGSYYTDFDLSVSVNNPVSPNMDVNIIYDSGVALGTGFSVGPFQYGVVARRVVRTGDRKNFGTTTISDIAAGTSSPDVIFNSFENEGLGYGLDMGFNFAFDTVVAPTLSFVIRDLGNTSFSASSALDPDPPTQRQEMALGASMVIDVPLLTISPSIDIRYLDNSDIQFAKKVHFGVEMDLPLLDLRAGYHQGYFSYGAGVSLGFIKVDFASWSEELGEYPGQLEDKRMMLSAIMKFGFDVGIGGSDSGSSASGGRSGSSGARGAFRRVKRRR